MDPASVPQEVMRWCENLMWVMEENKEIMKLSQQIPNPQANAICPEQIEGVGEKNGASGSLVAAGVDSGLGENPVKEDRAKELIQEDLQTPAIDENIEMEIEEDQV